MAEKKTTTRTNSSASKATEKSNTSVSAVSTSPEKKLAQATSFAVAKIAASNFVVVTMLLMISGLSFISGSLWASTRNSGVAPVAVGNNNAPAPQRDAKELAKNLPEVSDADHFRGNKDADVVLVEYSDFQCPFCERFHPTVNSAVSEFGDKFAWVYRHFPLDTIHPLARKMAQATECAYDQGGDSAFWAYGDVLFEQKPAAVDELPTFAGELGLESGAFKTCLDSDENKDLVEAHSQGGTKAGITGTPGSFIINRKTGFVKLIEGAVSYNELKAGIEEALASK